MAKRKAAAKPPERFKLDDFRGGAVCGLLCLDAFKDPSVLDPVRKWIADGKLVFAPGQTDILEDLLFLQEPESPATNETAVPPSEATPRSDLPSLDYRNEAERLWDSWPEGWQRLPVQFPLPLRGAAGRVMERIWRGAKVRLQTGDGIREVHVTPDGELAQVWYASGVYTHSLSFRWESIEEAIEKSTPLAGGKPELGVG